MKYFVVIISILLTSCVEQSQLADYVNKAEAELSIQVNYDVKFSGGVPEQVAARCMYGSRSTKQRILVNHRIWENLDTVEREILILHEIGHCSFGRRHDDSTFENDIGVEYPVSSMHTNILDSFRFIKTNQGYLVPRAVDDLQDVQYFYDEMKAWRDAQLEGKHEALGKKCDHQ